VVPFFAKTLGGSNTRLEAFGNNTGGVPVNGVSMRALGARIAAEAAAEASPEESVSGIRRQRSRSRANRASGPGPDPGRVASLAFDGGI
jgi:hypothetical protein